ncbi:hypothetical protein F7018_11620 [Tenacibaculum aiptasiae]|uniref:Uncharacterized protein n=1 Tax=Tenacibaculum aiptasiae TaxID=426481 RepID=A0A7J5AG28_9FLAO|nr:hypothetical protein [Tenacibaculum aiptasiae]KAB1155949.1 hypothetical protein F7018_11620 [Tenacibaculum aiptasiae]
MRTKKAKRYDEQFEREIEKSIVRFSEHLMSNSKWVRLIDRLVDNSNWIEKIEFKKVQNEKIGELYLQEGTTYGFDYWQNGFEGINSLGGWLAFKEIEYLIFPKAVTNEPSNEQYLIRIQELIESIGQFALDTNEERIKLICYR